MTSGVQLVQQLQYRHQGVHQQVAEKSPFSYINYCSLLKYKCVDIINSLYRLIEERLHRNSYKNGDPVTTATTSKVCLKSPGTDVGAAGFGMGVPGLLRQTIHVEELTA